MPRACSGARSVGCTRGSWGQSRTSGSLRGWRCSRAAGSCASSGWRRSAARGTAAYWLMQSRVRDVAKHALYGRPPEETSLRSMHAGYPTYTSAPVCCVPTAVCCACLHALERGGPPGVGRALQRRSESRAAQSPAMFSAVSSRSHGDTAAAAAARQPCGCAVVEAAARGRRSGRRDCACSARVSTS